MPCHGRAAHTLQNRVLRTRAPWHARLDERGVDDAGRHAVDGHAAVRPLAAQRLRDLHHRRLGRVVRDLRTVPQSPAHQESNALRAAVPGAVQAMRMLCSCWLGVTRLWTSQDTLSAARNQARCRLAEVSARGHAAHRSSAQHDPALATACASLRASQQACAARQVLPSDSTHTLRLQTPAPSSIPPLPPSGRPARACFCGCGTSREAMLAVLMMRPAPAASMCRPSACAPPAALHRRRTAPAQQPRSHPRGRGQAVASVCKPPQAQGISLQRCHSDPRRDVATGSTLPTPPALHATAPATLNTCRRDPEDLRRPLRSGFAASGAVPRARAWQQRKRPLVLTPNVRSHSCSGVSSAALFLFTPALFTAMSSRPRPATVSATILGCHAGQTC